MMNGICLPVWGDDFAVAHERIRKCQRLGTNFVQLVTHHYIETAVPYEGDPIKRTPNSASAESLLGAVDLAHSLGMKVMIKPHLDWLSGGWRGYIYFRDDDARRAWELSYRAFMSEYTAIAMVSGAECLCIGCEFADINKDPEMVGVWSRVISDIRGIGYDGDLTYAANWGYGGDAEYNRPGLQGVWEQLDFVGVDAYYPLSTLAHPTINELRAGWTDAVNPWWTDYHQNHTAELAALSERTHKRIVFTEVGYPATDYAGYNPGGEPDPTWEHNERLQANAYRAVFDTVAKEPWFDGAFWWQGGILNNSHQLFQRPAGEVLRKRWAT